MTKVAVLEETVTMTDVAVLGERARAKSTVAMKNTVTKVTKLTPTPLHVVAKQKPVRAKKRRHLWMVPLLFPVKKVNFRSSSGNPVLSGRDVANLSLTRQKKTIVQSTTMTRRKALTIFHPLPLAPPRKSRWNLSIQRCPICKVLSLPTCQADKDEVFTSTMSRHRLLALQLSMSHLPVVNRTKNMVATWKPLSAKKTKSQKKKKQQERKQEQQQGRPSFQQVPCSRPPDTLAFMNYCHCSVMKHLY